MNIQYTYHVHKNGDGNITDVEYLTNSGGCYTKKQERKETTSVVVTRSWLGEGNNYNIWGNCSKCSGEVYLGTYPGEWGNPVGKYISHTHSLGYFYYHGCGKTTDTIESATIIY